jgi:hypothetical protein
VGRERPHPAEERRRIVVGHRQDRRRLGVERRPERRPGVGRRPKRARLAAEHRRIAMERRLGRPRPDSDPPGDRIQGTRRVLMFSNRNREFKPPASGDVIVGPFISQSRPPKGTITLLSSSGS